MSRTNKGSNSDMTRGETTRMERGYPRKVLGCWQGKCVGGTLGMPYEGALGPHDLTFYRPVPTEAVPNDDLDLQIVWACHLLAMPTPAVTPEILAAAWQEHVDFHMDEYAVCLRNLQYGLTPPLSGQFDNWFANGMGAAIRSEIWACLAPGDPARAAAFAYCDACCDHAGDGVWAEVFLAAIEALAFVEPSRDRLLDAGLKYLPAGSRLREAVEQTRGWHAQGLDWQATRRNILDRFGQDNFTDVVQNLAFIVLGLLYGEGDFGKSLCLAVNCGSDSDCTGATLGSILGILDPEAIPTRWLEPIGNSIKLSDGLHHLVNPPGTVQELTAMVIELRRRLAAQRYAWDGSVLPRSVSGVKAPVHIPVRQAFIDTFEQALAAAPGVARSLHGHWNAFSAADFARPVMVLRAALHLDQDAKVRLGTYADSPVRSWLNGQPLTSWDAPRWAPPAWPCVPASHRSTPGTYGDVTLPAGDHELVIALHKPPTGDRAELILLASDPVRHRSLPWALARRK